MSQKKIKVPKLTHIQRYLETRSNLFGIKMRMYNAYARDEVVERLTRIAERIYNDPKKNKSGIIRLVKQELLKEYCSPKGPRISSNFLVHRVLGECAAEEKSDNATLTKLVYLIVKARVKPELHVEIKSVLNEQIDRAMINASFTYDLDKESPWEIALATSKSACLLKLRESLEHVKARDYDSLKKLRLLSFSQDKFVVQYLSSKSSPHVTRVLWHALLSLTDRKDYVEASLKILKHLKGADEKRCLLISTSAVALLAANEAKVKKSTLSHAKSRESLDRIVKKYQGIFTQVDEKVRRMSYLFEIPRS